MISVRRLASALLALLVTAAGVATLFVPSSASAATWKKTDRACYHNAAGSMCLTTFSNGARMRATVALAPRSGHWMKLSSLSESQGYSGGAVCAEACSPRVRAARSFTFSADEGRQPIPAGSILSANVDTDRGSFQGAAGRTEWGKAAAHCVTTVQGKACVQLWIRINRGEWQRRAAAKVVPSAGHAIKPVLVRIDVQARTTATAVNRFQVAPQHARWTAQGRSVNQPGGNYQQTKVKFTFAAGGRNHTVSTSSFM